MGEVGDNKGDDEISLNLDVLKKVFLFLYKHKMIFLVLIPILLTIYIRALPIYQLPLQDSARNSVYKAVQSRIYDTVNQQFPNLPDDMKQKKVAEEFAKVYSQNAQQIEAQIQQVNLQFREHFSYKSGDKVYPYLGDLDSYYWLRFARNIKEKGSVCDEISDGKCYDTYTTAPIKSLLDIPMMHVYSIYWVYNGLSFFNKDMTLMQAAFLTPMVFAIFTAIFVFLAVKRHAGTLGGLVAAILVATHPVFLSRSFGSDTDVYVVFFPALIIWLTFEAFYSKKAWLVVLFSALAGIAYGLFAYAWSGWWQIFIITFAVLILHSVFIAAKIVYLDKKFDLKKLLGNELLRNSLLVFVTLLVVTGVVFSWIYDFGAYLYTFSAPFSATKFKVATAGYWPNVLTTVAEFGGGSYSGGIGQSGGKFFFGLALLGIVLFVFNKLSNFVKHIFWILGSIVSLFFIVPFVVSGTAESFPKLFFFVIVSLPFIAAAGLKFFSSGNDGADDFRGALILHLLILSALLAVIQGNRFLLLFAIPVGLGVGLCAGYFFKFFSGIVNQFTDLKFYRTIAKVFIYLFILSFIVYNPIKAGESVGKGYMPTITKGWVDSLTYIKDNSKPDAIINSWWDFGHWFKYWADRRVTLDGSSQNNPQLHWLGMLIYTPDENMSVGILRMLDCGAHSAFEEVEKKTNFTPESIDILHEIISVHNKSKARQILLKKGFSSEEADNVLEFTHCNPPENFYITSGDMVYKGAVWAHFGAWDFNKAYMQNVIRFEHTNQEAVDELKKMFNMSDEQANAVYAEVVSFNDDENNINSWISPWPGYASAIGGCSKLSNFSISCPLQQGASVFVNLTTMDAYVPTAQGIMHPDNIVFVNGENVVLKEYENNSIGLGMILISDGDNYGNVLANPSLSNSMFSKLFFLDGKGTKYFKKVYNTNDAANNRIIVWKIEWPKME